MAEGRASVIEYTPADGRESASVVAKAITAVSVIARCAKPADAV